MIFFPNAKINLGLHVLAKRPDGYHDLETLMYPVRGLCDALEIIPSEGPGVRFSTSGLAVDGPPEKNLCLRAYEAFRRQFSVGGVRIHLHKAIPMGAGLGGGSADAAWVIRGLADVFELDLSLPVMEEMAAGIGSDTAFFVANRPALATGRGEVLVPVDFSLAGYRLVILKPSFGVSTAQAYARVTPRRPAQPLMELLRQPVAAWRETVVNDFEASVFRQFPLLEQLKQAMYQAGALYAAMSGSGSALFGLFPGGEEVLFLEHNDLFVYQEDMG